MIQGLGCPAGCGDLRRPVAGCGSKLWPLYTTILSPWGWQAGRMAGWLDGAGGHQSCDLARSTPRRVGGSQWLNTVYTYMVMLLPYFIIVLYHQVLLRRVRQCKASTNDAG